MSSSARRAWFVAASIGAVEALKDQGFCRWNYGIRVLQQHVKNNMRPYAKISAAPAIVSSKMAAEENMKRYEETLRKVMYLSCWGPY